MTVKPGWARKRPTTARRLPPTTAEIRREPASGDRSIWDLNRDEQRTMMITVVGGLGSIILGVVVIAIAIKLVRTMNAHPGWADLGQKIWASAIFGTLTVFGASFFRDFLKGGTIGGERIPFAAAWRRTPPRIRVALVVILLGIGLYGLALLGYAAGIK